MNKLGYIMSDNLFKKIPETQEQFKSEEPLCEAESPC